MVCFFVTKGSVNLPEKEVYGSIYFFKASLQAFGGLRGFLIHDSATSSNGCPGSRRVQEIKSAQKAQEAYMLCYQLEDMYM